MGAPIGFKPMLRKRNREVGPINLKPRLAAVAEFVPAGSVVVDIGADHAYIPLYLVKQGISPRAIAVEKVTAPFNRALSAVRAAGLMRRVEVRRGDGMAAVGDRERIDVLIIAGLGGENICNILQRGGRKLNEIERLILQPMKRAAVVRRWLIARGFHIAAEKLALEKGRIYEIIVAERGRRTVVDDPLVIEIGPCLVEKGDPLLEEHLKRQIARCGRLARCLSAAGDPSRQRRGDYYRDRKRRFEEVHKGVCQSAKNN